MRRLVSHYRLAARILAWIGIFAIIVLSVVPANDRPVTGVGVWLFGFWIGPSWLEHFTAFALVAGMFAIGYSFSLIRLVLLTFVFCGSIELLQVPLPTRHARVSDFIIDFLASCFAIAIVFVTDTHRRDTCACPK